MLIMLSNFDITLVTVVSTLVSETIIQTMTESIFHFSILEIG